MFRDLKDIIENDVMTRPESWDTYEELRDLAAFVRHLAVEMGDHLEPALSATG